MGLELPLGPPGGTSVAWANGAGVKFARPTSPESGLDLTEVVPSLADMWQNEVNRHWGQLCPLLFQSWSEFDQTRPSLAQVCSTFGRKMYKFGPMAHNFG